jgi:hypothetical protein
MIPIYPKLPETLTIRLGSPADEDELVRLAALDSAATPAQPVLLAEVDGHLLAAVGISDGTVVADPFHLTADLVDLLRTRARQLTATPMTGWSGRRRWRLTWGAHRAASA